MNEKEEKEAIGNMFILLSDFLLEHVGKIVELPYEKDGYYVSFKTDDTIWYLNLNKKRVDKNECL